MVTLPPCLVSTDNVIIIIIIIFEYLMFIIRKSILHVQPYMVYLTRNYASSLAALPSACQTTCINASETCYIKLHVKYGLPDDEHKML